MTTTTTALSSSGLHNRVELLEPRVLLAAALERLDASPPLFVENRGQWDPQIHFAHRTSGAQVLITDSGAIFRLSRERLLVGPTLPRPQDLAAGLESTGFSTGFPGANRVTPLGREGSSSVFNYYIGDASTWRTDVAGYGSVVYPNLYDGIDLHAWGHRSSLKYEFRLAPGADWRQIAVTYDGIEGLTIAEDGSLLVNVGRGWDPLRDDAPYVYQQINGRQVEVDSSFVLVDESTYRFEIGRYDPSRQLIIDPDLMWSRYLGGSGWDSGTGVAVDSAGNAFVAGRTTSTDFLGANNSYGGGEFDSYVAKLSPAGTLLWATYFGGSAADLASDLALDAAGSAFVSGYTTSTNLAGANNSPHGWVDVYVAKFTSAGGLLWSTYLGGDHDDRSFALTVDAGGYAFVTGWTVSSNFAGASNSHQGGYDAFVVKLSGAGARLWARYLGGGAGVQGTESDIGYGIALDGAGNVFVGGETTSLNFEGAINSHSNTSGAPFQWDAFVAKLSGSGAVQWARYVGGGMDESGEGLAVDNSGNALLTGFTSSADFPAANNLHSGQADAYVAKVTGRGNLLWSTFLGGSHSDGGEAITMDSAGNALVTGRTWSADFAGASNSHAGGTADAFAAKVSSSGTLRWARYFGGSSYDGARSIALDGEGHMMLVGQTSSTDLAGAMNAYRGNDDAFVAKIAMPAVPSVVASQFEMETLPQRVRFTFDTDVSASLGLEDLVIEQLPAGPTVTPGGLSYDTNTNTATVTFTGVLADARYRATLLAAGITNASGTPMAADHVFDFRFLSGDANNDGHVNLQDFNILAANFGQSPRTFSQGDFNYDGIVNLRDFNLLASRFGLALASPAMSPQGSMFGFSRISDAVLAADTVEEL